MSAPDVRERHGVHHSDRDIVTITEKQDYLSLTVYGGNGQQTAYLTPNEARYIAAQLYRVARRISARL
jgi:hypothetical protein